MKLGTAASLALFMTLQCLSSSLINGSFLQLALAWVSLIVGTNFPFGLFNLSFVDVVGELKSRKWLRSELGDRGPLFAFECTQIVRH